MTDKLTLMPNVAIVLKMNERRSFLGPKEDGFVYLASKEALDKFEAHILRYRSREEYSEIDERELRALTDDGVLALSHAVKEDPERPWLWTKTDFRIKLWQA